MSKGMKVSHIASHKVGVVGKGWVNPLKVIDAYKKAERAAEAKKFLESLKEGDNK